MEESNNSEMQPTPKSSATKQAKIVVPATNAVKSPPPDKKGKPEFVVSTNYPDSNAPLGVSVSKFNKNHIVVSEWTITIEIEETSFLFFLIILSY